MKINFNSFNNNVNFKSNLTSQSSRYINQDRMLDSFISMAKVDTGSDRSKTGIKSPTTQGQLDLAKQLSQELKDIGLKDINIDKYGILTATLPSNIKDAPTIGFISHLDTSSDAKTSEVNPIIHNYESGNIELKDNTTITSEELEPYKGHKIITSDGTTLLGADDKAGIAEIIEALKVFVENPELKRPTIKVAFTPDEEGCNGAENFNIPQFNADVAYTVDGLEPEYIDVETFNAFNPEIVIKGIPTHLGFAYNKMVNSISIANEFIQMLPKEETPEKTKDKEGFYHVHNISGNIEETKINMRIRDFDYEKAKKRIQYIKNILNELQEKYPEAQIEIKPNEAYQNIKNYLSARPEVIEYAKIGIAKSGLTPIENAVRGGTDGSYLTLKGLLCPNLGAGGVNFHTNKEFISLETMSKCCENIINIAQTWAENNNKN